MGVCIYFHMSEEVHELQELVSYAGELKLQMVLSCLMKVLRTKLGSFERARGALNCQATLQPLFLYLCFLYNSRAKRTGVV